MGILFIFGKIRYNVAEISQSMLDTDMKKKELLDKLEERAYLEKEEWVELLTGCDAQDREYAAEKARAIAGAYFGGEIYVRGLIEFTNYCKNNCYYCGIRKDNKRAQRYRLTEDEILACCKRGYRIGLRTFVLQGGEDGWYTDARMMRLIRRVKREYPDCALTLSVGEKEEQSYRAFYEAGADRYLLRHETADEFHYRMLHPREMSLTDRKECLQRLKAIGYQTGCGFMVGSPGQTAESLAADMDFVRELHPHMIGIGPFVPHRDTPFAKERQGGYELTLFLLSLLRIMEKNVLLPATTALGAVHPEGREAGILAGANVLMQNLCPVSVRKKYSLYERKADSSNDAAERMDCVRKKMEAIGRKVVFARGDWEERRRENGTSL